MKSLSTRRPTWIALQRCIIDGAAFEQNLLCIGEKEVFVVASVADKFIDAMRRAGAYQLDVQVIERLSRGRRSPSMATAKAAPGLI